ncbi:MULTISPECIES: hypothetical protein [Providencia]|uniref:Uncharacterized protein n=2 Tax=Providencia heimbachae TaxID=333962 RepID=A0A1B7K0D9_9GAMM|nr:hypothetical protein [Providencia heimbachae]MBP6120773.1 hypothetical protein [Providencia sp.]NIH23232.1 hypothetical protein [Providencia heimbachae]OAT53575.1 hypothetical protein M998_0824 [Providencia heimbachae ATCC 35613]SQH13882.1 Uncharacterised protein [Providencia heimbachae]
MQKNYKDTVMWLLFFIGAMVFVYLSVSNIFFNNGKDHWLVGKYFSVILVQVGITICYGIYSLSCVAFSFESREKAARKSSPYYAHNIIAKIQGFMLVALLILMFVL